MSIYKVYEKSAGPETEVSRSGGTGSSVAFNYAREYQEKHPDWDLSPLTFVVTKANGQVKEYTIGGERAINYSLKERKTVLLPGGEAVATATLSHNTSDIDGDAYEDGASDEGDSCGPEDGDDD